MREMGWARAGAVVALLWSGVAGAGAAPTTTGDGEFLKQALGVNQLELQLGKLAAQRASSPEVKASGAKMVENHTKLGQQLGELAREAGVAPTPQLTAEQRATYDRVAAESGARFDAAFTQTVDAGHVKELAMYRTEASRAESPKLRAFAEQRVSALEKAVADAEQRAAKPPVGQ
jgi:putative membrane protein